MSDYHDIIKKMLNELRTDSLTEQDITMIEKLISMDYYNRLTLCMLNGVCKVFGIDNIDIGFFVIQDITINRCILDPLGNPISDINNIQVEVSDVNDELLKLLSKNPDTLYQLSARKYEEVIAEILYRKGYEVKLTSATRDGGKDIYVTQKTDLGSFLYVVECKKYNPSQKVGISILRDLYGVVSKENLTAGIIATTSYFSKPAQEFQQELQFKLSLKDFDDIQKWLYEIVNTL